MGILIQKNFPQQREQAEALKERHRFRDNEKKKPATFDSTNLLPAVKAIPDDFFISYTIGREASPKTTMAQHFLPAYCCILSIYHLSFLQQ